MALTNIGPKTGEPINQDTGADILCREVMAGNWLQVTITDVNAMMLADLDLAPVDVIGSRAIVVASDVDGVEGDDSDITFDIELGDHPHLLPMMKRDQFVVWGVYTGETAGRRSKTLGIASQEKERVFAMPTEAAIAEASAELQRRGLDVDAEAAAVADEVAPGKGADQITKLYLRDRKNPVLIHGDLDFVHGQIWGRADRQPRFQVVTRDGMVSEDEIVINRTHVVSIQSERDHAPTRS